MRKYRQDNNGGDCRTKAINGGMHLASMRPPFALCLVSALVVCLYWISSTGGEEKKETKWSMATAEGVVGGIGDVQPGKENALEIKELGRFAVEEHNKKANDLLEFVDVVKAKEQTVAGTLYYLTIEAVDGGQKKLYEAKIWVKPWMHFKELQEFNQLGSDTSAKAE